MTACVNRKHTKKVAAVVTASLVGALSLGAAPVAAVADTGIDMQFAEGGIEGTEFANGTVTLAYSKVGGTVTEGTDIDGNKTITADQIPFSVTATAVQPAGSSDTIDVTPGNDYKISLYKADENGEPTGTPLSGNRVLEAGDYVLTVTPLTGSDYVGQTFTQFFKVVAVQIQANAPYEHGNQADHNLMFTGSALDLDFEISGKELVEGKDYTVKYTKGGKTYDEVVDAGTYTATLTGLGMYAGTSATTAPFTVSPYHLESTSTVVVNPFTGEVPTHPSRVYWTNGTDKTLDVELDPSLVALEPTSAIGAAGVYTFNVSADADAVAAGNIVFSSSDAFTVNATKADAFASFSYNGAALEDSYDIFPGQSFNINAVTASYNGTQLGVSSSTSDFKIVDGYANTTVPGEYKVTFEYIGGSPVSGVSTALNGKYVAGSKTVTIRVWAGSIDADTQLWVYGPDSTTVAINSYGKAYDGRPLYASSFTVTNKDGSVSTDGTGAKLSAKLYDASGNEVPYALNAGEYTLKVTSDDYKLSGTTELKITIGKVDLTTLEVGNIIKWNLVAGEEFLPVDWDDTTTDYDCSTNLNAISGLDLIYNTGNEADAQDQSYDFKGMDRIPDNADVTVEFNDEGTWKPVAKINEAGQYRVTVTVGEDVASNYVLPEGETSVTIEFTASQRSRFTDVQPSAWYYEVVNQAAFAGIMKGYSGTNMFGPEDTLTRGQVVCVLFNMSGASEDETGDAWNEHTGWNTGFDDVDGTQFYGEAIYWAKKTGVVNGYADGTFKPEQTVTREEFASMLANYAKVVLGDATVGTYDADTVLAEYPDGEGVTDWAADNVAWAAAEGIMGNNGSLMPTDTMTRAYCAAMAMNYLDADRA